MMLRILFGVHAIVTAGAGVVLVIAPAAIPGTVGIRLTPDAYLLSYLLAAVSIHQNEASRVEFISRRTRVAIIPKPSPSPPKVKPG